MPLTATQPLARQVGPAARLLPAEAATAEVVARGFRTLGDRARLMGRALAADDPAALAACRRIDPSPSIHGATHQ